MAVTIAELGVRVLRRLGVAVVPAAERPALSAAITVLTVAQRALEGLGVTVPAADRPPLVTVVSVPTLGLRALQWLGVVASDETPNVADQDMAEGKVLAIHDALVAAGVAAWPITAIPLSVAEDYMMLAAMQLASSFGKAADPAQRLPLEERMRRVSLIIRAQDEAQARVLAVHDTLAAQGALGWASTAIPQAVSEEYVAMVREHLAPLFGQKPDLTVFPAMEARVRRFSMIIRAPALAEQKLMAVHANLDARGKTRWSVMDLPRYVEEPYVVLAANMLAPEFALPADQAAGQLAMRELSQVISLPSSGGRVVAEYF